MTPGEETILSVNYGSRGTGNESCGAATLAQYQLQVGNKSYSYTLFPIPASATLDEMNAISRLYGQTPAFASDPYVLTAAIDGTKATVTLAVNDNTLELNNAMLIVAVYDDDSRLATLNRAHVAITGTGSYEAKFVLPATPASTHAIKAFAWTENYAPICAATVAMRDEETD
jgi:hypothetical protein